MKILSFDTSLPHFSVALIDDSRILGAILAEGKRSRNERLLPAVDFLLRESGLRSGELDRIVVTRGPGSFTGVRIGLATAQGLAAASGAELWPIGTHRPLAASGRETVVLGDAGRGDVYMSRFEAAGEIAEPVLVPRDEAPEPSGGLVVIDVDEWSGTRNLALVAALAVARGELSREEANPLYVRPSAAEEKLLRGEL